MQADAAEHRERTDTAKQKTRARTGSFADFGFANGKFYARFRLDGAKNASWIPIQDADTVAAVRDKMQGLKSKRDEGTLEVEKQRGVITLKDAGEQDGRGDVPVQDLRKSRDAAIKAAKTEHFGFQHLRHYFISMCVMSGIDFMTIAEWVGHQDRGSSP
jgi:hypothetical protein